MHLKIIIFFWKGSSGGLKRFKKKEREREKERSSEQIPFRDRFLILFIKSSRLLTASNSELYLAMSSGSTATSGGAKAGAATKSKDGLPTNFLANQRKGFSKL